MLDGFFPASKVKKKQQKLRNPSLNYIIPYP